MYIQEEMGSRIRRIRKMRNLTQKELAGQLGLSDRHISAVETGREKPGINMLIRLCEVFEVTPDYLLLGSMHDDLPSDITDRLRLCDEGQLAFVEKMIDAITEAPAWPAPGIIRVETKSGWQSISKYRIVCLEAGQKEVLVHTSRRCLTSRQSMGCWEQILREPQFFRPHRSFIVNFAYVTGYDRQMIELRGGREKAYMARRRYYDFHQAYSRWLKKEE
jgi:transcriptional regulator with XRE-family HTH domain